MANERVLHEIKVLLNGAETLRSRVENLAKGARYARDPDRAFALHQSLRQARENLDAALRALDPKIDGGKGKKGWFRKSVCSITSHLMGNHEVPHADGLGMEDLEDLGDQGFAGDNWSIPLGDLLSMLSMQQKSGLLQVKMPSEEVVIEVLKGKLVSARSSNTPKGLRLGEVLVAQGAIEAERLDSFLTCMTSRERLGQALMSGELVSQSQLVKAAEHQIMQLFHRLLAAESAQYSFREGAVSSSNLGEFNITSLLLETARQIDERSEAA